MGRILLDKVKIDDTLCVSCMVEDGIMRLTIMGHDVTISTDFKLNEWDKFVELINQAQKKLKEEE